MTVCLCLSVCLTVCAHISRTTRPNLTKFSVLLPMPWLSLRLVALQYVVYSVLLVFTAQGYAKSGICRRRVSVCLSHSGIVSKLLNVGSRI